MPMDYDQQLLESVTVRRNRMVAALLFGSNRSRRSYVDGVRRTVVGVVLAALLAAGCVGYSFVRHALAQAQAQQSPSPTSPDTPTSGATGYLAACAAPVSLQTRLQQVVP